MTSVNTTQMIKNMTSLNCTVNDTLTAFAISVINETNNCQNDSNPTRPTKQAFVCTIDLKLILYMVVYAFVIMLVVVGNLFILVKLKPFANHRRPNIEVLILYLSSFDLMASVMLIMDVYENFTCFAKWPLGWFGCKLIYPLYHVSLNMSVCILVIMAIDRCRSIVTPMKKKFTRRSIHIAVIISINISTLLQWYQFYGQKIDQYGECGAAKTDALYAIPRVIITITRDVAFIIVFTITSILIYMSLLNNEILDLYYTDRKKKETRRVIKMLMLMEIVFTVLVVPYDIYDCAMFISRMVPGNYQIEYVGAIPHVDRILSILQMSNSFANCFIYAKMHRYIRIRSPSTSTPSEYHGNRRETKQEVIWTNQAYQPDDVME